MPWTLFIGRVVPDREAGALTEQMDTGPGLGAAFDMLYEVLDEGEATVTAKNGRVFVSGARDGKGYWLELHRDGRIEIGEPGA